jgi:lysophospholipase L1-like esterase
VHSPQRTLVGLFSLFVLALALSALIPEGGLNVGPGDFRLKFPSTDRVMMRDIRDLKKHNKEVDDLIAFYKNALKDDMAEKARRAAEDKEDELFNLKALKLQYKRTGAHPLEPFFLKLRNRRTFEVPVRILHYGDSQIEGDRMTNHIRNFAQKRFGGSGPGLLPAIEFVPNLSIKQSSSGTWTRFAMYGGPKPELDHNRFGPLACFARFETNGVMTEADLSFSPNPKAFALNKKYERAVLYLGDIDRPLTVEFWADSVLLKKRELEAGLTFKTVTCLLDSVPERLTVRFRSTESPSVYGISLESQTGVVVDNIGMRGSSGTVFTQMGREHIETVLNPMNIGLIILQFGGNSVPYIDSEEKAVSYAKWFGSQIRLFKGAVPDAGIVVIGPSDMSTLTDGTMQTYPFLEAVRDAMRDVTIAEGCAYWDLYEIMGGKNSMPRWVNADPPLAGSDHIHFTLAGSRTAGELFGTFLLEEFENWKTTHEAN